MSDAPDAARMIEIAHARLSASLDALEGMVELVEKIGGFLSMEHQGKLADARFVLEHEGRRQVVRKVWRDR